MLCFCFFLFFFDFFLFFFKFQIMGSWGGKNSFFVKMGTLLINEQEALPRDLLHSCWAGESKSSPGCPN